MHSRNVVVRSVRALAVILMIAGYVVLVRGNSAEASAIFDAGGDAGLWPVGLVFWTMWLIPGAILLLVALALSPRSFASQVVAGVGGLAILAPTLKLAAILLPPERQTSEGAWLDAAQWNHVADLYLAALILIGAAGGLLLASAFARVAPRQSADTPGELIAR